jgi:hypothetical protein
MVTLPNPNFDPANPVAGVPQNLFVANPGYPIGIIQVRCLKLLCYYVYHLKRTQRAFVAGDADLVRLTDVYRLKEVEDDDADVPLPDRLTMTEKIRRTIEALDGYLLQKSGASGVPLAYIVTVLPENQDAAFGQPTYYEDMIHQAPHTGLIYQSDNVAVWNVLRQIFHGGPGWNWIQMYQLTMDGRSAYLSMKRHNLGESFAALLRSTADQVIDEAFFYGTRNFTFEQYCELLNQAFTDI